MYNDKYEPSEEDVKAFDEIIKQIDDGKREKWQEVLHPSTAKLLQHLERKRGRQNTMSKYIITFTTGEFEATNTVVVESKNMEVVKKNLVRILERAGYEEENIREIVRERLFYILDGKNAMVEIDMN